MPSISAFCVNAHSYVNSLAEGHLFPVGLSQGQHIGVMFSPLYKEVFSTSLGEAGLFGPEDSEFIWILFGALLLTQ